jgi:biotin transport system permease protein
MGSLYSEHITWLHGWRAGTKLAALAVLGSLLFWLQQPWAFVTAALFCAALYGSLGAATRSVRRLMVSVLVAATLVAVFHLAMGNLPLAVSSALRLACASSLGLALTVTTRSGDLVELLEWLLTPLRPLGVQPERLSLQLALMLRFTEHFFVQWKKLDEAHRLRTGRAGGLRLIAPLTVQMLQTARRVGDALFVRQG